MAVDLPKRLGNRIRHLRNRAGITQAQLAERVDISPEFMSRLERGLKAPSLDTAQKMANALGATLSELFHFDEVRGGEKEELVNGLQGMLAVADLETVKLVVEVGRTILEQQR
jgi:transcriptional regulator with XRE-family HTH domain